MGRLVDAFNKNAPYMTLGLAAWLSVLFAEESTTLRAVAPLTAGETALVQSVFGEDFKTTDLRKYYHNRLPLRAVLSGSYGAAYVHKPRISRGNALHMVEPDLHVADFSTAGDLEKSVFMHEMTHIWQQRTGGVTRCRTYDYTLTPDSRFDDFCTEQQGDIIGHYTQRFLSADIRALYVMVVNNGKMMPHEENLRRVVEDRFPAATRARLAHEEETRQQALCIADRMTRGRGLKTPRFMRAHAACATATTTATISAQPWPQRTAAHIAHTFRRFG